MEEADKLKAQKADLDKEIAALGAKAQEQEVVMRKKANTIGNIVHESVPVSDNEVRCRAFRQAQTARADRCAPRRPQDNNKVIRTFYPKDPNGDSAPPVKGGALTMKEGILSHHEVMYRLGMLEMERGAFALSLSAREVVACSHVRPQVPRSPATVATTSWTSEST
jgi:seryl-tRNA synthetase